MSTTISTQITHCPTSSFHSLWLSHNIVTSIYSQAKNFRPFLSPQGPCHLELLTSTPPSTCLIYSNQLWSWPTCSVTPPIPGTAQNSSLSSILSSVGSRQCSQLPSSTSTSLFPEDTYQLTTILLLDYLKRRRVGSSPLMLRLTYLHLLSYTAQINISIGICFCTIKLPTIFEHVMNKLG